jgi:hypothetical protein
VIKITVEYHDPKGGRPKLLGVGSISGGPTKDDPDVGDYRTQFNDLLRGRETAAVVRGFDRKRGIWTLVLGALVAQREDG